MIEGAIFGILGLLVFSAALLRASRADQKRAAPPLDDVQ